MLARLLNGLVLILLVIALFIGLFIAWWLAVLILLGIFIFGNVRKLFRAPPGTPGQSSGIVLDGEYTVEPHVDARADPTDTSHTTDRKHLP